MSHRSIDSSFYHLVTLLWIIFGFLLTWHKSSAQDENFIPNPGFEDYKTLPKEWNTSGEDFTHILSEWSSPSQGSPDVYGPDIHIPAFWRNRGFGFITAPEGRSFVGITTYGCTDGKPHCREYVQVRMTEPLVPGQKYELSFYTSPLPKGLYINNLGVAFTYDSVQSLSDSLISIPSRIQVSKIIKPNPGEWVQVKLLFEATARERFMQLGNFKSDHETKTQKDPVYTSFKFAYYYLDNIRLRKIPPIIEYVDTTNIYINRSYELDESVILENIYFDVNKSTLKPASYLTLAHLLEMMNKYSQMHIAIVGHTDSDGSNSHNDRLSLSRARTVYQYLIDRGIDSHRLSYKGEGERKPLKDNRTVEGKSLNRRVEFKVISQ